MRTLRFLFYLLSLTYDLIRSARKLSFTPSTLFIPKAIHNLSASSPMQVIIVGYNGTAITAVEVNIQKFCTAIDVKKNLLRKIAAEVAKAKEDKIASSAITETNEPSRRSYLRNSFKTRHITDTP